MSSSYMVCVECKCITKFGHARYCSQYTPPLEDEEFAERAFVVRGIMSGMVRDEITNLLLRLDAEGKQVARVTVEIIDPSVSVTKSQEIMDNLFPIDKHRDVLSVELVQAMVEFCDLAVSVITEPNHRPLSAAWGQRVAKLAGRIKELRGPTYKWPEL